MQVDTRIIAILAFVMAAIALYGVVHFNKDLIFPPDSTG